MMNRLSRLSFIAERDAAVDTVVEAVIQEPQQQRQKSNGNMAVDLINQSVHCFFPIGRKAPDGEFPKIGESRCYPVYG